jgi:hypothetical protein
MVIMGVNMLGIFPWLRRFNLHMPRFFAGKIEAEKDSGKGPLYVGLLNGLMPCGPLQAMQLYALSTGSPLTGAVSMLLFSLGTVPLMFGLGALSSVLSKKFTHRMMTVGAVLVAVLGLSMFLQGWNLSGFSLPSIMPGTAQAAPIQTGPPTNPGAAQTQAASGQSAAPPAATTNTAQGPQITIENGVQLVNSTLSRGGYPSITVQAGVPVRWTIDAPQGAINGCNNRMLIPAYNVEHQFEAGENVIEFTPTETGKIGYSCWMGMIRGTIIVVEAEGA